MKVGELKALIHQEVEKAFAKAHVQKLIHHELEEILWSVLGRDELGNLRKRMDKFFDEVREKLKDLEDKAVSESVEKLMKSRAIRKIIKDRVKEVTKEWEFKGKVDNLVQDAVESVRERLRSEVELRVKAFLDEQRVDWEKRIDELLKEIKDRYFISLIEERLKGLISTVDSLERRVRELEQRPITQPMPPR